MTKILNIEPEELIEKTAEELKKIEHIKPQEWAKFVKSGAHKERPPVKTDWWYVRAASVLRTLYKLGPIGVSKLRTKYGGKQNRGCKPERFRKASGNILRKILQQLEKAGLAKQAEKGVHKGRVITPKGIALMDRVARSILGIEVKSKKADVKIVKEVKAKKEKIAKKEEEKIPTVDELVEQTKKRFSKKTAEEVK